MASVEQILSALRRAPTKGVAEPSAVIGRVQEWKGMGESMVNTLASSLSDIESREDKVKLATESLEARWRDLKEKERQLELLDEGKREALKFMEEKLKLRDEELDEQLKAVHDELEKLEVKQDEYFCLRLKGREKMKEIEKRERELDREKVLMEGRMAEIDKREREFHAYHDEKMRELTLKEEVLVKGELEFAEKARLMSEEFKEKQKASNAFIERMQSAQKVIRGMMVTLNDKFKDIESREMIAYESLSARLNEADVIQESLEKRFKEIEDIEKKLKFSQDDETRILESKEGQVGTLTTDKVKLRGEKLAEQQTSGHPILENKDEENTRELELKQDNIVACEMEHDYEQQDCGEKSPVRESAQTCAEPKLVSTKLDHHLGEAELKQRPQGLEQPTSTTATSVHLSTNQGNTTDARILKDVMTLAMVINGPEKDLESMGDEIFKILSLSSDPAKVVLRSVEAFYADCSEMLVKECKERKRTIIMLDQLAILSPNIPPCVTEAAIKLAREWKSRMSSTSKIPMETLTFLNLVAAFKLSSHFDRNELFNFLMVAARHKQAPVLCHTLGLVQRIPGHIKKLINEKKYLLASTFVYEYQLQDRFPQAAILNYYIAHVKSSANAKCGSQHNSPEAKKRAAASEIAALRAAMKHISQYGLESDFPPIVISSRIKQLEVAQASMRRRIPTPSKEIQKQGKGGRAWRRRKAHLLQAFRDEGKEPMSNLLNPRMSVSCHGSNGFSSSPASAWTPKHQVMSQAETSGYANCRAPVNSAQMPHHVGPYKRSSTNRWRNEGGFHVLQFASSQY